MKKQFIAFSLALALACSGSMQVHAAQMQEVESAYQMEEQVATKVEQEDGSFAFVSESDEEVVSESVEAEGLTQIEAPAWIKWDHSKEVGNVKFATVDAAEGAYDFELYKDGNIVAGRRYRTLFRDNIGWADDINESGTYVVEVAALGDGETTGDSTYTRSDEFVYVKPATVLGVPQNIRWNEENPTLAEWDPVENAGGYEAILYLDGKRMYGRTGYSTTFCSTDWAQNITESGHYTFTVRALSGNINEIANGAISEKSDIYNADSVIAQVNETLDAALEKAQTDANAALDVVKGLNKSDLQAAMQADEEVRDKIEQLADMYASQNNVNVSNNVDASICDKMDASKIHVIGTALNAVAANTNMTLNFSKPEQEAVIDTSQYKNAVQIDITLDGVADSQNLSVPMTMTVPIPNGVSTSRFHIIHCHVDGTQEIIHPIINEADRTATFTITRFSTFVFANEATFTDVDSGAYYAMPVRWAVEKGITTGTSPYTFSPNEDCTRGQIVTFLWRAAGTPKPASDNNPFEDVSEDRYFYQAVLWAVENGITTGTSATTFSPDETCTRGQAVAFLYRYAGQPEVDDSSNPFDDVESGRYFYQPVLWAVEKGVTTGTSPYTFSPNDNCTRGQIVTFLYRQAN